MLFSNFANPKARVEVSADATNMRRFLLDMEETINQSVALKLSDRAEISAQDVAFVSGMQPLEPLFVTLQMNYLELRLA
jgi:hypothetical protein